MKNTTKFTVYLQAYKWKHNLVAIKKVYKEHKKKIPGHGFNPPCNDYVYCVMFAGGYYKQTLNNSNNPSKKLNEPANVQLRLTLINNKKLELHNATSVPFRAIFVVSKHKN